ncbi:serine/threonine-protein phosphatase BSL3 [Trifolium repens]|nr:serine/threonine-protein phosphatase BSL3 [Trifolium repens]
METTHSYLSVSVLLKVKLHFLELCFTNLSMVVVVVRVFDSKPFLVIFHYYLNSISSPILRLAPCYTVTVVDAILEIRRWTRVVLHVDGYADSGRGRNGGIHWAEADFVWWCDCVQSLNCQPEETSHQD